MEDKVLDTKIEATDKSIKDVRVDVIMLYRKLTDQVSVTMENIADIRLRYR